MVNPAQKQTKLFPYETPKGGPPKGDAPAIARMKVVAACVVFNRPGDRPIRRGVLAKKVRIGQHCHINVAREAVVQLCASELVKITPYKDGKQKPVDYLMGATEDLRNWAIEQGCEQGYGGRLQPPSEGLVPVTPQNSGTAVTAQANKATVLGQRSAVGFLGGQDLAEALGIDLARQVAFFAKLGRERSSLGDDCWQEVANPRPNKPKFLYLADAPTVVALAAAYAKKPV